MQLASALPSLASARGSTHAARHQGNNEQICCRFARRVGERPRHITTARGQTEWWGHSTGERMDLGATIDGWWFARRVGERANRNSAQAGRVAGPRIN